MYAAFYPLFSIYGNNQRSELTRFRALKINGNENSKVFDRRTKVFHKIVLLQTIHPVHGTMGVFAVPDKTPRNSKVGYCIRRSPTATDAELNGRCAVHERPPQNAV